MKATLTDEELIRLYFFNQPSYCFETLYNRYYQKVYRQCLQLTQSAEQAQDFSQDIFIKLFQQLGSFQKRSRFSSWLYAITRNYCQDQRRLGERFATTTINNYLEMTLADKTEPLSEQEMLRQFRLALASLSYKEQRLLRLKYEQDLSLNELASLSGLSLSAVKMRLKRSRDKVQRCYANQLAR